MNASIYDHVGLTVATDNRHYRKLSAPPNWPTARESKSISALPPEMGNVLSWFVLSSITRPLRSHGLVIGKHPQDTLVRPLMHTSRFDRDGAVCAPIEASA